MNEGVLFRIALAIAALCGGLWLASSESPYRYLIGLEIAVAAVAYGFWMINRAFDKPDAPDSH